MQVPHESMLSTYLKSITEAGKPEPVIESADSRLDTQGFDSISAQLGMTYQQITVVVEEIRNVRAAIDALKKTQSDARSTLGDCSSKEDCAAKYQKFKDAVAAVKSYNAQAEFETRIFKVLNPEQISKYKSARVAQR
jgi:hypothetical protein